MSAVEALMLIAIMILTSVSITALGIGALYRKSA